MSAGKGFRNTLRALGNFIFNRQTGRGVQRRSSTLAARGAHLSATPDHGCRAGGAGPRAPRRAPSAPGAGPARPGAGKPRSVPGARRARPALTARRSRCAATARNMVPPARSAPLSRDSAGPAPLPHWPERPANARGTWGGAEPLEPARLDGRPAPLESILPRSALPTPLESVLPRSARLCPSHSAMLCPSAGLSPAQPAVSPPPGWLCPRPVRSRPCRWPRAELPLP